jgi:hypothetical protein
MLKQGQKWKTPWSKIHEQGSMVVELKINFGKIFMNFGATDK